MENAAVLADEYVLAHKVNVSDKPRNETKSHASPHSSQTVNSGPAPSAAAAKTYISSTGGLESFFFFFLFIAQSWNTS